MTHLENEQDNLDNTQETLTTEIVEDNSQQEEQEEQLDPKEKRHQEQLAGSKQEVDRLFNTALAAQIKLAQVDGNNLLELYNTDPKLAKAVAKHFNYDSKEALEEFLKADDTQEKTPEQINKEQFDKMYEERRSKEVHQESLQVASKIIDKLPENLQEEAREYFDEMADGKKLTIQKATKFAEMATLYVKNGKISKEEQDEAVNELYSTGLSGSKKKPSKEPQYELDKHGNLVLISN